MGGRKENNVVTAFRKERHGALRGVERYYDTIPIPLVLSIHLSLLVSAA